MYLCSMKNELKYVLKDVNLKNELGNGMEHFVVVIEMNDLMPIRTYIAKVPQDYFCQMRCPIILN